MAKSNRKTKTGGRPRTGITPTVTIRLPAQVISGLDAMAKTADRSRTDVMREILEQALAAQPKPKPKPKPTK